MYRSFPLLYINKKHKHEHKPIKTKWKNTKTSEPLLSNLFLETKNLLETHWNHDEPIQNLLKPSQHQFDSAVNYVFLFKIQLQGIDQDVSTMFSATQWIHVLLGFQFEDHEPT